jgi:hypothetical protein
MRGGTRSSAEPWREHGGLQRRARGGQQGQRRSTRPPPPVYKGLVNVRLPCRSCRGGYAGPRSADSFPSQSCERLPPPVGAAEAATPVLAAPTASRPSPASARLPSSSLSAEPCRPLPVARPTRRRSPGLLCVLPLPPDLLDRSSSGAGRCPPRARLVESVALWCGSAWQCQPFHRDASYVPTTTAPSICIRGERRRVSALWFG